MVERCVGGDVDEHAAPAWSLHLRPTHPAPEAHWVAASGEHVAPSASRTRPLAAAQWPDAHTPDTHEEDEEHAPPEGIATHAPLASHVPAHGEEDVQQRPPSHESDAHTDAYAQLLPPRCKHVLLASNKPEGHADEAGWVKKQLGVAAHEGSTTGATGAPLHVPMPHDASHVPEHGTNSALATGHSLGAS